MNDRAELAEAALDVYPEGLALLDLEERVVFWNRAAEAMTGYSGPDMVGRRIPEALEPLASGRDNDLLPEPCKGPQSGRGFLVHVRHKRGHDVPAFTRRVILRDDLGAPIGAAATFHASEKRNALPHGDTSEGSEVRQSQAETRGRLENEYELFLNEERPLGVLWVCVDQAPGLQKTHGARACEAMVESVERTLANALRSGEEVGRWGDGEFLVLSHERSGETLAAHAQMLTGIARTADFRWWGDRISLTVSIGAALAEKLETLRDLLERAQSAMQASTQAGGNLSTLAPRRQPCSPS